jgi:hypothetical protein
MHYNSIPWRLVFLAVLKLLKTFGLIPGAMTAYWLRRRYQKWRQARALEGWPSTEARILSGTVHSEGPRRKWAEITYSYYVGEYRAGKYLRLFRREEDADEFVREIKDKRVYVRYKERDPDTSTILDRDLEMIAPVILQKR